MPRHARFVGQALKFLQDDSMPWQRVLLSSGHIASRGPGTDGARRQRLALEAEGVNVAAGDHVAEGGGKVDWADVGWFPDRIDLEQEE